MNVNKQVVNKVSILFAALGLAVLLSIIVSGAAYPHPFFRFGAPWGLLFVFVGVFLQLISWILDIYHGVIEKQYRLAAVIAVLGLLVIWMLLSGL